jgi:hypothetical protein
LGFVLDKSPVGLFFSEYFGFPANHSVDLPTFIIITIYHPGLVQ